jgi:hypothetical protein
MDDTFNTEPSLIGDRFARQKRQPSTGKAERTIQ